MDGARVLEGEVAVLVEVVAPRGRTVIVRTPHGNRSLATADWDRLPPWPGHSREGSRGGG